MRPDGVGLFNQREAHGLFIFQNHVYMMQSGRADTVGPCARAVFASLYPFIPQSVADLLRVACIAMVRRIVQHGEPGAGDGLAFG